MRTEVVLKVGLLLIASSVQEVISVCPEDSNDASDYYWREYTGAIPCDALPGGKDTSGNTTYIGQMYLNSSLLPAIINKGSKSALACWGGNSYTSDEFIKIFCTKNPQRYRWILTRNHESHLLTNCRFVIGGFELGHVLRIGRVDLGTEIVVGKIFEHDVPNRGFYIPYKGKEASYKSYEILTYNCDEDTIKDKPCTR